MVYDNVGHISPDQSDDLCRIATGFGYSTRTLFSTDEETTFEFARPQIITAIDSLVTRDDLADRVLMVQLGEISEQQRLPQAELNAKIEAARPRILGALLTALSQTLAALPNIKPDKLPRMADYAKFAIASEQALGLKPGEFMEAFSQSREQSRQVVIESSPVGEAIIQMMEDYPLPKSWTGTTSELLKELEKHTDEATYRSRYFPKASNILSRQLARLTPDLKAAGIIISEKMVNGIKNLTLEKAIKVSPLSPPNGGESASGKGLEGGDKGGDSGDKSGEGGDTIPTQSSDRTQDEYKSSGGDTFAGGDKGGDKKTVIPIDQTTPQHGVQDLGGDSGDKKSLLSKESSNSIGRKPDGSIDYDAIPEATEDEF